MKNHAHQAEAARQTLHHLHTAADHALVPVIDNLAARQPSDQASRTLAHDVRAAVPDHADRILTDPAWPALATVLADAEAGGHKPHQLLKEAAAQRELTSARQPARVLITRIQHTSRNPAPNPRAEAARRATTMRLSATALSAGVAEPARSAVPAEQKHRPRL
ncbi:hypothetical protein YUWDRAFT_05007 [Streptomyces sp. AmelKG-D3]|nr:hypothetical protein YUWDRAFT_05007 [Streptomyces sp. AmelKG-D3]